MKGRSHEEHSAAPGKERARNPSSKKRAALASVVVVVVAAAASPRGVNLLRQANINEFLSTGVTKLQTWLTAGRGGSVAVTVFANGESNGGVAATLTKEQHGDLSDVGLALSPLLDCGLVVGRHGPDDPGFCKVHNGIGRRVRSLAEIKDGDSLYLVPQDRLFVFPTVAVGHRLVLPHVEGPIGRDVEMVTLAHSPRVFELHNFMSQSEADQVVRDALAIEDEAHMLKRSSTGTRGGAVSSTRTSENAFLTSSGVAMKIKHRIFNLLGIEQYRETWADGLQVLRYNVSKAYIAHLDYLEDDPKSVHDFDSSGSGINRFATVLLYFTEPEEGGETVFVHAPPPGTEAKDMMPVEAALEAIREDESKHLESIGIKRGSWEERLLAQCRSRLAFKPKKGSAVLFYSQHPDGRVDKASEHGACPVMQGQKWAANLWVWNGPRYGYTKKDPRTGKMVESGLGDEFKVLATFRNEDVEGAVLYYQDDVWKELEMGEETAANSFVGHDWNVRVGGQIVMEISITEYVPEQTFSISQAALAQTAAP